MGGTKDSAAPGGQRRRSFMLGGPALLLALALFLNSAGLLTQRWWLLPLSAAGLLLSYWLPRRFRFNASILVLLAAFIVAGVKISALRETVESNLLVPAYEWIAALLVTVSSFKVFGRLDLLFTLGIAALLCIAACAIAPGLISYGGTAAYLLLALPAAWPLMRRRKAPAN